MKLLDISPLLHSGVAVWPGDTPFSRQSLLEIGRGDSVNLSSMRLSLHAGAHVDAPYHFLRDGETIDESSLEAYWGPALVATLPGRGSIKPQDLVPILKPGVQRLLVRCHPNFEADVFPRKIRHFSVKAARMIGRAGVRLIGVDAPSVDPLDSATLAAHRTFGRYGTVILENLSLRGVPDGGYELVAFPLKIAGGDASPVRAVLRPLEEGR